MTERLEPRPEPRARATRALGDRTDPALIGREEVQDPVGLAEPDGAQHDSLDLPRPRAHSSSLGTCPETTAGTADTSRARLSPLGNDGEQVVAGIRAAAASLNASMAVVRMYSTEWCGYCERAKKLLEQRGLDYEEIRLDAEPDFRRRLHELTGGWTVPQIVIDGTPIGGYLELWRLDREGVLEGLADEIAA